MSVMFTATHICIGSNFHSSNHLIPWFRSSRPNIIFRSSRKSNVCYGIPGETAAHQTFPRESLGSKISSVSALTKATARSPFRRLSASKSKGPLVLPHLLVFTDDHMAECKHRSPKTVSTPRRVESPPVRRSWSCCHM